MLDQSPKTGLSDAEVTRLRHRHGFNELPEPPKPSVLATAARQFTGPLILILVLAAIAAAFLGERIDSAVILGVVVLNGILGFVQEWRAERALAALRAMLSPTAIVRRAGAEAIIPSRELVPGDIILLSAGTRVPADAHLTEASDIEVDESIMTGESLPVSKVENDPVYSGTTIVAGRAEAQVEAIGAETRFGEVSALTGSVGSGQTVLQQQFARLAGQLGLISVLVAAAVALLGIQAGKDPFLMVLTGISLAVAIVPEGLPAVVTITLALGASAMVRRNALARRLQAVETLGAASVICTDKTGTLTENKMTAVSIWTADDDYTITGTGYAPEGEIRLHNQALGVDVPMVLHDLLQAAAICNHAKLSEEDGKWSVIGAPTEGALVTLAQKGLGELPVQTIDAETAFTSERKRMSVLVSGPDGPRILMKGAPEQILARCSHLATESEPVPLDPAARDRVLAAYDRMAANGHRVIAIAQRDTTDTRINESEMQFLGLVGLIDPPRPEVEKAVQDGRRAGIRVVMITGDSAVTGRAIATDLGIETDRVLTGDDLGRISDEELADIVTQDILFARTRPADKLRIVAALQSHGQVVAMTGDGVNDAPALKQADIGVAMGLRGTDVAKEASDLVLLDDNFATIVQAIREGRRQFENIKKFVRYLLSSNAGEVVALVANIIIGGPLIFLATQILWMNLITDGVTAVALGLERAEKGLMDRSPRRKTEPVVGRPGLLAIILFGTYTGSASLWIFYTFLPVDPVVANTAAFTAMVFFEKMSVFAYRSLRNPVSEIGWFSNPLLLLALVLMLGLQVLAVYWPPLQTLLHTVPLGWEHWQPILLCSIPLIVVPELIKRLFLSKKSHLLGQPA
ncbi:MAG: cation-transporting P-type ATPase [Pseudomonadota bacterium]